VDFGLLLGYAYQAFVQQLHARMAERGFPVLGASYGYVLRTLAEDSRTASQLGERLGITAQGAAKVIDEMVGMGYVERRPDPADKRAKQLHLSAKGQEMLRLVREFHAEFEQRLAEEVGAEQVKAVRTVLAHIADTAPPPDLARLFRPI
jgi:DNA-binding MarR family transcriptional regulator